MRGPQNRGPLKILMIRDPAGRVADFSEIFPDRSLKGRRASPISLDK